MELPRKYVVIGTGKYVLLQVLIALRTFSDAPCLVVSAPGTRFLRHSILASEYVESDLGEHDDAALLAAIHDFADGTTPTTPTALIPADCPAARWVDRVGGRLAIPVAPAPDTAMLDKFDNKWQFHRFCRAHGLPTPDSMFAANKHLLDFDAAATRLGLPFVVKPLHEQASAGVVIVRDEAAWRHHVLDNPAYRHAPLMAQRHIAGSDVGINLLAIDGALDAIAVQRRIDPSHDGSPVEFFADDTLEEIGRLVARKSRYTGVMNIDARIDARSGKAWLLEANPRFWRSLSASVWCGMNFVERCVIPTGGPLPLRLRSGRADTYYHPLFRPALWPYVLFDRTHRGRMTRTMAAEICTLTMSARILGARTLSAMQCRLRTVLAARPSFMEQRSLS
jgi:biotin carboxylase